MLGLGLIDKADKKRKPDWPAIKNISCTEHLPRIDTHDYGILTDNASQYGFTVEPEFIFPLKDLNSSEDNITKKVEELQHDAQHSHRSRRNRRLMNA
jgi:hypothetical protein